MRSSSLERRSTRESAFLRVARTSVAAAIVLAFGLSVVAPLALASGSSEPISILGRLPESPEANDSQRYIIGIDEQRDKLLYVWRRNAEINLNEYDLGSVVPKLVREKQIGTYDEFSMDYASPYTIAIDYKRQLAYFMAASVPGTAIRVVDLRSLDVVGTWELGSKLPGFFGEGITYSEKDKRLYLVGNMYGEGHVPVAARIGRVSPGTAVVAVAPPKDPTGEPKLSWARAVPQCQYVLSTLSVGALIARSADQAALYFACVRPEPHTGQSALIRLWIDPKADHAAAAAFQLDFFPISGSYTTTTEGVVGTAAFDQVSERFFIQSVSATTPGTWVFDGRLSSWVGFIAAPNNANLYQGLDLESGRFYMGSPGTPRNDGKDGYLLVTDGRATPIPQGRIYSGPGVEGFVTTDPRTDRLFIRMNLKSVGLGKGDKEGFVVLGDRTPKPERPRPVDYDELTSDLPEGEKTITDYSGGINGYGSRILLVGGFGGVLSASGQQIPLGPIRGGDRGFTAARLSSLDLRSAGASATGRAFVPDLNTEAEIKDGAGQEWPWRVVSCLNGGGESISDEDDQQSGYAKVECDIEKATATATARFGRLETAGMSVGSSSMAARAMRDPKVGTLTEVTAEAKGIEIATPGGTLRIAKVVSQATTVAHGHAKTAAAGWTRLVSGVEVIDVDGQVVHKLGSCDSSDKENPCGPLEKQINDLLPQKVKVEFPNPKLPATPKGAFAAVQQSDADYYGNQTVNNQGTVFPGEEASRAIPAIQVTIYNDTQEKSRLVLMLAALQANSIYTISPQGESPIPGAEVVNLAPVSSGSGSVATSGSLDFEPVGDAVDLDGDVTTPTDTGVEPVLASQPLDGTLAFIKRSPQEAALVGLIWLTFGAAGWTMFRRGKLIDVLRGGNS